MSEGDFGAGSSKMSSQFTDALSPGFRYYHCYGCRCVYAFTSTTITGAEVCCPFCLTRGVRAPNPCPPPSSSSAALVVNVRCKDDLDLLEDVVFYSKAFRIIGQDIAWFLSFQSRRMIFESLLAGGATMDIFLPNQIGLCCQELVNMISQDLHDELHLYTQHHGTPPAGKSAVQALPDVRITTEILASYSTECSVCRDDFETGTVVKKMPCEHLFHKDCILQWLKSCNLCPVCRFELQTDVAVYNDMRENLRRLNELVAPRIRDSTFEDLSTLSLLENSSPGWSSTEKRRFIIHIHQSDAGH